ncbi:sensor histidine kinase [Fictibacillus fluitans]|uniref:histidine kinase n=1 Tax=Fictibacillus fluitans TaxID=3058422 RepID=A0ABT8HTN1_9BACL|nr:HAMP domain-containing sensor histidine kinase [Fictibacillus sp. NE201]MDN4524128.1 HAMP domain-containing sensor histidine kinase [Fictibacillus sp. NE201]
MSIKKRLILSNIAMIAVPVASFFILEMIIALLLIYGFHVDVKGSRSQLFMTMRFVGLLVILTLTNGLLTYAVARSILIPVRKLSRAAEEISNGNLDYKIEPMKKDELGQLSETFESMRIQLKTANDARDQYEKNRKELIASVSHDLKTPLTSIKGYVKGILDGVAHTPEKQNHYLQTVYQKAAEMDQLIDELFFYSKLDAGQTVFQYEPIDLRAFFEDVLDEVNEVEHVHAWLQTKPEETYMVKADRSNLGRVVHNLIQNSLKYTDTQRKEIQVSLMEESDHILVGIADNGSGIGKQELQHIFDSFYRAEKSRNSSTGGSGLGLSIAKKIIERHGGEIWVASEEGKGTSIFFTLKKEDSHAESADYRR